MVAIGIDLGTTNTVIGAVVDGVAVTLEDEKRRRLLPSIVSFHPSGNVLVGYPARDRRLIDPANTIFSVKRLIGRSWGSPEVAGTAKKFPFKLVEGPKNTTMVSARDIQYALPEISAFVLRRAKALAEEALGETVDRAVITVPANFNDLQRASTKVAGKLAGLEVLRILNEPTAAALAYGQTISEAQRIAVYDLGGGTFDITLLDLSGSVFEVLSTAGDTSLGGDDFDMLIADRIAEQIIRLHRYDPRADPYAYGTLRIIAEFVKQQLSVQDNVEFEVRDIGLGDKGDVALNFTMTRAELEELARPLVQRTIEVTNRAIEGAGLTPDGFDRILLVGGATRMPLVSRMVEEHFGKKSEIKVNPDEVVALGAAIQANALSRSRGQLTRKKTATRTLADAGTAPADAEERKSITELEEGLPLVTSNRTPAQNFKKTQGGLGQAPPGLKGTNPGLGLDTPKPRQPTLSGVNPGATDRAPGSAPGAAPGSSPVGVVPVAKVRAQPPPLPKPNVAAEVNERRARDPRAEPDEPDVHTETGTLIMELSKPPALITFSPPPPRGPGGTEAQDLIDAGLQGLGARVDHDRPAFVDPRAESEPTRPAFVAEVRGSVVEDTQVMRAMELPAPPVRPPAGPASVRLSELPVPIQTTVTTLGEDDEVPLLEPFVEEHSIQGGGANSAIMRAIVLAQPSPEEGGIRARETAPLLIDVTPLSLRVETVGGFSDTLIQANSPVPCDRTRLFSPAQDNQTTVTIRVAQGESAKFAENTFLGELDLSGIPAGARGEVTFELDADGILNVRAREPKTNRQTKAVMRLLGANTDAMDVERMMQAQAKHVVL